MEGTPQGSFSARGAEKQLSKKKRAQDQTMLCKQKKTEASVAKIKTQLYQRLVSSIKIILKKAIQSGGTTLRDFTDGNGNPGYFKQSLNVYGRAGKECKLCQKPLNEIRQAQRSTVYCAACQR